MTTLWEVAAQQFEPHTQSDWATPGDLARHLDPRTVQTPMLDIVDEACIRVMEDSYRTAADRGPRLIVTMPPQEGKSQRLSRRFPLWVLLRFPELRIAIASYEANVARRWGRAIRDDIVDNPELGLRINANVSAQHEWQLANHTGGVYTVGVGGSLTGRPVDLMIIDDPVKDREQADSEVYRERVWNWWTETVSTRLSPGAPVILIMTRWHPDDLAGRLIAEGGWEVLSISAEAETEPDPLGRKVGEFLESARGRTRAQWEAIKSAVGVRSWSALYQQAPTPGGGLVFLRHWIDDNRRPLGEFTVQMNRILVSVDPAAKAKPTSDLTGIIVVGLDKRGHGWVLDDRTLRGTPTEWGVAVWTALIQWKATEVVIEDNQGGDMVRHVLDTTFQPAADKFGAQMLIPSIVQVQANQSKRVRAEAAAALYEQGRIHHAGDGTAKLQKLEDQMTTWTGSGKSPDRIDALVHGLTALATPRVGQRDQRTRTR